MSYTPVPGTTFASPNPNSAHYSNNSVSHQSKEDIELAPVGGLPRTHSDSSHATGLSDHKVEALHLAHTHESRERTTHGRARRIMRNIWITAFLPVVAFAYLAFCYTAARSVIPVRVWKVDEPEKHLYSIKAGVTTISIMIVTIALLPLKALLDDLKSEEFFRSLRSSQLGVPLKAVNDISAPSHSYFRGIASVLQRHASKYYGGAILTGLAAVAISSLAPAALSVGIVHVDNELKAFEVGAVGLDSIYRSNLEKSSPNNAFTQRSTEAASMAWVQTALGVDITFKPTSPRYAVPVPLRIGAKTRARYLTDVIVMDPVCSWEIPNPPVVAPSAAMLEAQGINVTLSNYNIAGQVRRMIFHSAIANKSLSVLGDANNYQTEGSFKNISTNGPISDGTMAWMLFQCTNCEPRPNQQDKSVVDFSQVPTQEFTYQTGSGNTSVTYTSRMSFLVCNPRYSVETREVRLDGSGSIEVMESQGLKPQGNLHVGQTGLLFTKSLFQYSSDSGPDSGFPGMGKSGQVKLFFGNIPDNATAVPVLTPLPIDEITAGYTRAQQAAMRSYLSGVMASAYVPGRTQTAKLVFTSSLPHIIVSTILFASVALFINICHLRSDTEQFTLFAVSAALARSNIGGICEDVKYADIARGHSLPETVALQSLENRRVRLVNNGGPGHTLHMD